MCSHEIEKEEELRRGVTDFVCYEFVGNARACFAFFRRQVRRFEFAVC